MTPYGEENLRGRSAISACGGKPSAGGTDPSAPGGSQSNGQTGPQGGTTISDGNRRVLEGWAAQTGRITGEPGDGARVLYFKKERDE